MATHNIGFDLGPVDEFKQYAYDGLLNAGYLFQTMAGQIGTATGEDPALSLHYLAIILAFIGGMILVLNRKCHNPITLISWTFLLLICTIGPKNYKPFFTSLINTNTSDSTGNPEIAIGFTPQIIVIDFFSKMHRAVYNALFEYDFSGKSKIRNFSHSLTNAKGLGIPETAVFSRDSNVRELMSAYGFFCQSDATEAAYLSFPNQAHAEAFTRLQANADFSGFFLDDQRADMSKYPTRSERLQRKTFTLGAVAKYMEGYYADSERKGHPPFAIYFEDPADTAALLNRASSAATSGAVVIPGAPTGAITAATAAAYNEEIAPYYYNSSTTRAGIPPIDALKTKGRDLSDLYISHEKLISGTDSPFRPGQSERIYFKHRLGGRATISTIKEVRNHRPLNSSRGAQFAIGANGAFTQGDTAWSSLSTEENPFGNDFYSFFGAQSPDPIHGRTRDEEIREFPTEDEAKAMKYLFDERNLSNLPVRLGFVLSLNNSLFSAANKKIDASHSIPRQFISVDNCAQLHQMTHLEAATEALTLSGLPLALLSSSEFKALIEHSNYENYEEQAEARKNIDGPLGSFFTILDEEISRVIARDTGTNLNKPQYLFDNSDNDLKEAFIEWQRQKFVSEIIATVMRQSTAMYAPIESDYAIENNAIDQHQSIQTVAAKFQGVAKLFSGTATWSANLASYVAKYTVGGQAIFYTLLIMKIVGFALFIGILVTPLLYLAGLANPTQAPGVIINSLLVVAVFKMVPITFTIVDFAVSYIQSRQTLFDVSISDLGSEKSNAINSAILTYTIASAYTSIVAASLFILFRAGDTSTIMSGIQGLDRQANDTAKTLTDVTGKVMAAAAALPFVVAGAAIAAPTAGAALTGAAKATGKLAVNTFNKMPTGEASFIAEGVQNSVEGFKESSHNARQSGFESKNIDGYLSHHGLENNPMNRFMARREIAKDAANASARSEADSYMEKAIGEGAKNEAKKAISNLTGDEKYNSIAYKIENATSDAKDKMINNLAEGRAFDGLKATLEKQGIEISPDELKLVVKENKALTDLLLRGATGSELSSGELLSDQGRAEYAANLFQQAKLGEGNKIAKRNKDNTYDAITEEAKTRRRLAESKSLSGGLKKPDSTSYQSPHGAFSDTPAPDTPVDNLAAMIHNDVGKAILGEAKFAKRHKDAFKKTNEAFSAEFMGSSISKSSAFNIKNASAGEEEKWKKSFSIIQRSVVSNLMKEKEMGFTAAKKQAKKIMANNEELKGLKSGNVNQVIRASSPIYKGVIKAMGSPSDIKWNTPVDGRTALYGIAKKQNISGSYNGMKEEILKFSKENNSFQSILDVTNKKGRNS